MSTKKPTLTDEQITQLLHDIHTYSINYHSREIFLTGYHADSFEDDPGVEYRSAGVFMKNLSVLESLRSQKIVVHMQIGGGSWPDCMAMYDAMRASKSSITMVAYAQASSASGVVLQGATRRLMMPNTHFMLHYGSIGLSEYTTSPAASQAVSYNDKECQRMLDIFAARAVDGPFFKDKGWDVNKVSKYLDKEMRYRHDWYLSAEDAVKMGFADGIVGVDGCKV